jgi:hypothetical protein
MLGAFALPLGILLVNIIQWYKKLNFGFAFEASECVMAFVMVLITWQLCAICQPMVSPEIVSFSF